MSEFGEPWRFDSSREGICDSAGIRLLLDPYAEISKKEAERIVACVNACRGIPTEELVRCKRLSVLARMVSEELRKYVERQREAKSQ